MLIHSVAPVSRRGYLRVESKFPRSWSFGQQVEYLQTVRYVQGGDEFNSFEFKVTNKGRALADFIWTTGVVWLVSPALAELLRARAGHCLSFGPALIRGVTPTIDTFSVVRLRGAPSPDVFEPRSGVPSFGLGVSASIFEEIRAAGLDVDLYTADDETQATPQLST